jgi:hypothetical protein
VPCPTTILTDGLLLMSAGPRWRLAAVVPLVWSVVGGSAAILFGVTPDYALLAGGAVLAIDLGRRGRRT